MSEKYLRRHPVQNVTTRDGAGVLQTASQGLDIRAQRHHFKTRRRMKLKCVATIYDIYHRVNEISVEKTRRKRPAGDGGGGAEGNQSSE